MIIRECMKRNVVSILETANIRQAAARLVSRKIGMLPVVDASGHLVGILQLRDLLSLVMPDFLKLVDDFDFVTDFGAVESYRPSPEKLSHTVREVMEPPISVEVTCSLIRAFAIMNHHGLIDLPVLSADGHLVGIASSVDIATGLSSQWSGKQENDPL